MHCVKRQENSGQKNFTVVIAKRIWLQKRLQDACGFKYDYKSEEKTDPRTGEKYVVLNKKIFNVRPKIWIL